MKVLLLVLVVAVFSVYSQETCPRCTPLCQNGDGSIKVCGDNGCGGSCGTCPSGQSCCQGTCACQPNCNGRQCGDDGCGYQSCGQCSSTQTCSNGVCVGTATAECSGRVCGSNRAGGSCGSCSNGQRCRNGQCECYYDCNERNCGNAVQPEGANLGFCPQRSCGTCPNGFTCGSNGRCSALTPCTVSLTVVDCNTRRSLSGTSTVMITQTTLSYSTTVTVTGSAATAWNTPGLGTFRFQTSQTGYLSNTQNLEVTATTTALELCISPATVQLDVRNIVTNTTIEVGAGITYSGVISGSLRWTGVTTFTHGGYGSYSFVATPDSRYLVGSLTNFQITASTTLIIIYVQPSSVLIDIRYRLTDQTIGVGATVTYSGVSSGSFRWNGVTSFTHSGFGTYSFFALPDSTYTNGSLTQSISSTTSLLIIYVDIAEFCGDGKCSGTETATFCFQDCVAIFFEFENADGSGPVNGPTVNYFLSNPRDASSTTGPNRNGVVATTSRTTGTASNTVLEETYSYGLLVYVETTVTSFINFYWVANTSNIDPGLGTFRLRVHLSRNLGSNDFNYRFVNTWKPIDATPEPFGPTDLNLHLFHSAGALDINNPQLLSQGFAIGAAVADSKQSGGPATMDISPASGVLIGVWNSKPPRSSVIAPSQNNRYLVNSGSYVVVYGKTSNAATGKQLGQIVLDQLLQAQPSLKSDTRSDLWFAATFTARSPGQDQPEVTAQNKIKASTINSARDMFFDCEVYSYCNNFRVPYSDTGRRSDN